MSDAGESRSRLPQSRLGAASDSHTGVGFLGGGAVTQAIHLPALSHLTDLFTVRAVMDASETTARAVAARTGARATTSVDDVLNDESVDVVVVCSPPEFHAEQAIAACRAQKRAVLCEKPLATTVEDASRIVRACAETGVPLLVGTMHAFDPGWIAFAETWGPTQGSAQHIRCSVALPPNQRFEEFATEVTNRAAQVPPSPAPPVAVANLLRGGILGLATHDLPLIRVFLTDPADIVVRAVQTLAPFGYLIVFSAGEQVVELHAYVSNTWHPRWSLEAYADDRIGTVEFTPSYVQAGSATCAVRSAERQVQLGPFDHNGYVEEWRHVYEVTHGHPLRYAPSDLLADLTFALDLARRAEDALVGPTEPDGVS